MAANNYFSFTHGGTQYGAASAAAYQTAQPGYAVTPAATAATYSPQRAATGYETAYQTAAAAAAPATYAAVGSGTPAAPAAYDYSYATATQTAYNTAAKTYYQQPAAGAATYSTTETHYQGSKPAYSTTSTYTATTRQAPQGVPKAASYTTSYTAQPAQAAATNYSSGYNTQVVVQPPANTKWVMQQRAMKSYNANQANTSAATFTTNYTPQSVQSQAPQKPKISNTTYSGYDAAVYNAATLYVAQQTAGASGSGGATTAAASATPTNTAGSTTAVNKIHQGGGGGGGGGNVGSGGSGGWVGSYRKGPMLGGMKPAFRAKAAPKQQQVHYCEVCRISCAGPQTYREHLEGQKHKKKEAMMKSGGSTPIPRGVNALKCELCDVDCTGSDAYAAHIRGARHQKVVKLHTKLGKPIPSQEPVVQGKSGAASASTSGTGSKKLVSNTPKINFVATGNLGTVGTQGGSSMNVDAKEGEEEDVVDKDVQPVGQDYIEEIKNEDGKQTTFTCKLCDCRFNDPNAKEMHLKGRRHRMQYKKKVNPELVVEVKQTTRQRKQQDEKARRQQLQQEFLRRRDEERMMMRGFIYAEEEERMFWEERRRYEEEMECYEWYRRYGRDPRALGPPMSRPFGPPGPGMPSNLPMPFYPPAMRRPDSMEDRYVMARHTEIYPKEDELEAVQKIVSHTEKALKFVSDHLAEEASKTAAVSSSNNDNANLDGIIGEFDAETDALFAAAGLECASAKPGAAKQPPAPPKPAAPAKPATPAKNTPPPIKKEDGSDGSLFSFHQGKDESSSTCRVLKGVMRVGVLAKGLLLHGDTAVNLVVLCSEKPTRSLLYKVHENLPKQLQVVAPDDCYSVKHKAEDAALVVIGGKEPHITVTITLTSPVMREPLVAPTEKSGDSAQAVKVKDPPDVLDKQKCLEALAALRHAKWFQARATQLQSCVMIIRILRDLCQRVPTWAPLHSWAMELLVEKVLNSTKVPLSPGEALRRVLEALASGILLPGGPGLLDLCEKEPVDAAGSLNAQQREDITASAQQALRLLAFRQIHKVLGMDILPPLKSTRPRFPRKRRREGSGGEGNDSEAVDGKKDKKDEAVAVKMETESSK